MCVCVVENPKLGINGYLPYTTFTKVLHYGSALAIYAHSKWFMLAEACLEKKKLDVFVVRSRQESDRVSGIDRGGEGKIVDDPLY